LSHKVHAQALEKCAIRVFGLRENPYISGMAHLAAPLSIEHARVPICTLDASHRPAIESHLLALGEHDRYLRFGYAARDLHIRRYVESLRFGLDEVFGIFNRRLHLIAMAHLAYATSVDRRETAEFGVSVSRHARGRGYGRQLFERVVVHARNHGVNALQIHALSENAAMLHIARQGGARVVRDGTESEAYVVLPQADFGSQMDELLAEQVARTDYHLKKHGQRWRQWWQRWAV
jgi:GNAT superfamily N-acetyltransferase